MSRQHWTSRLAPRSSYLPACPIAGSHWRDMTIELEGDSGHEYELEVTAFCEFEPAQNGGWDDPSWPASYYDPVVYWHRRGHGWKRLELTASQEKAVLAEFYP